MKACEVKGTNQGIVTNYKTFTFQYNIHFIYNCFTYSEQDEVRYSTDSFLTRTVLFQQ